MEQPARARRPARNPVASPPLNVRSASSELLRLQQTAGNAAVSSLLAAPDASAAITIQRYKSYEHVKAGAVESFMGEEETPYVVKKDETPASIAKAHGTTAGVLLERNKAKSRPGRRRAAGRSKDSMSARRSPSPPTGSPPSHPPRARGAAGAQITSP